MKKLKKNNHPSNYKLKIIRTSTEVRNMYMLFALCENGDILNQLILNNLSYVGVSSPLDTNK